MYMEPNTQTDVSNQENRPQVVDTPAVKPKTDGGAFHAVQRVSAWVMILSGIFFTLISLLAIWKVFGDNTGDVVWRSLSSLGVIAVAALIVNVAARAFDQQK